MTMKTPNVAEATESKPSTTTETEEGANADDSSPAEKLQSETSAEQDSTEEGAGSSRKPYIQLLTGMKEDLAACMPLYRDDWKRPKNLYVLVLRERVFLHFVFFLGPLTLL